MASAFMLPDYVERKGSLYLRSGHMNYSRATLNSNWHQARESEPKDYDISIAPARNLCKATYQRIGDVTDGTFPETTYQDHSQQIFRCKRDCETRDSCKPMVNQETFPDAVIDRDTGAPEKGHGAILPGHHPEHDKRHLETTFVADYKPPYPYTTMEEKADAMSEQLEEEERGRTIAYKRPLSQFGDTGGHKRPGWNTWQDESGVYGNTHYKRQVFQPTRTITAAFE